MQCSLFSLFDDSDRGFIIHCAKDPRPHQVNPSFTQYPLCKQSENIEHTLLIKDLRK